ncbi:hypothetical protein GGX14DRAFT_461718 [Mycena pura]|uniref:Uncharacterized protein n=1 Tax=Mycena pura TaxID=153505 RepID=A0AAD6V698_9AGAR|nr:hypothetical protein GGX14DRAFT_461718 [Mycena pura]
MWLQLFPFFLLPCAQAQAITNPIESVTAPSTLTNAATNYFIQWTWTATIKQSLNNITMELISGAAEDNGNDIVDIIVSNFRTLGGNPGPNLNNYAVHTSVRRAYPSPHSTMQWPFLIWVRVALFNVDINFNVRMRARACG